MRCGVANPPEQDTHEQVIGRKLPIRGAVGLSDGVLRGWMAKRSGLLIRSWEVRWIELNLQSAIITYWAFDRDPANSEPRGTINILATGIISHPIYAWSCSGRWQVSTECVRCMQCQTAWGSGFASGSRTTRSMFSPRQALKSVSYGWTP